MSAQAGSFPRELPSNCDCSTLSDEGRERTGEFHPERSPMAAAISDCPPTLSVRNG